MAECVIGCVELWGGWPEGRRVPPRLAAPRRIPGFPSTRPRVMTVLARNASHRMMVVNPPARRHPDAPHLPPELR